MARVIIDSGLLPNHGATKAELDAFLESHGFRCLTCQEERQPMVGCALYIRDWKSVLGLRLTNLLAEAKHQATLATERQRLAEQLAESLDGKTRQADGLAARLAEAEAEIQRQATLAAERHQLAEQLAESLDGKTRQADGLGARLAEAESWAAVAQSELARASANAKDRAQENEFLLLQLHQIQQEHESCLIKLQASGGISQSLAEAQETIAANKAKIAALAKQAEEQAHSRVGLAALVAGLQARIKQLTTDGAQGVQKLAPRSTKILTVVDNASQFAWQNEFEAIPLDPDAEPEQAAAALVESATDAEANADDAARQPVLDALANAKDQGMPIVFWDNRPPKDGANISPFAKLADMVFVGTSGALGEYAQAMPEVKIGIMPLAANPRVFNPSGRSFGGEAGTICAYGLPDPSGGDKALQSNQMFLSVLRAFEGEVCGRGLTAEGSVVARPDASLSAVLEADIYRRFRLFLNVDSLAKAMVPRRVYEALACGTPVVSAHSAAIDEAFPGIVQVASNAKEAKAVCKHLLSDEWDWLKLSHCGYREVMLKHTYRQRADLLLDTIGFASPVGPPLVSIIMATMRPHMTERIVANIGRQSHPRVEVIVVTQNYAESEVSHLKESLATWAKNIERLVVIEMDGGTTLGARLNIAIGECRGESVAKMDDDDIYFANYLQDMLIPFSFGDYGIVGKRESFIYLESQDKTFIRYKGDSHKPNQFVAGPTFVMRREIFQAIGGFADVGCSEDSGLLHAASQAGIGVYASDPFNFVQCRFKSVASHTWQVGDNFFLDRSVAVGPGLAEETIAL
ncbi:MAG: glycosyltransferase [Candidatus Methylumidiphilus sp.]